MNDREMLELAAKAAWITGKYGHAPDDYYYKGNTEGILTTLPDGQMYVWNPLVDDGDALRLAVKLRMVVDTDYNGGAVAGNAAVDFGEPEYGYQEGQGKPDPYAATRRAVVRAAAEIGKGMK